MSELLGNRVFTALDIDGNPISGALLYFYLTGTTNPVTVYANASLTTPRTQPVVCDAAGRAPDTYFQAATTYKMVIQDSTGGPITTIDPVVTGGLAGVPAQPWMINFAQASTATAGFTALGGTDAVNSIITPQITSVTAAYQAADTAEATARANADAAIALSGAGGLTIRDTLANLNAFLTPAAGAYGYVYADGTPANIGYYIKTGATGTGSWTFSAADPTLANKTAAAASATAAAASAASATGIVGAVTPTLSVYTAQTLTTNANAQVLNTGAQNAAAGYQNNGCALTGAEGTILVTALTVGTGLSLAVFYSDAGTTLQSVSTQKGSGGGTQYTDQSVTVPGAARYVRVNTTTAAGAIIKINQVQANIANRLTTVEGYNVAGIATALNYWQTQSPTIVANANISGSGTVNTGTAGYEYAELALPVGVGAIRATGFVIGTGRSLAYFYSDTACTTYIAGSAQFAGTSGGAMYSAQTLTVPTGARGLRVNSYTGRQLSIEIYGIDPNAGSKIASIGTTSGGWKGKIAASFGDSVTGNYNWQPLLFTGMGLARFDNNGVGGTRVAYNHSVSDQTSCMCDDARINAIASDADFVTFMCAINDFGQSSVMGALTPPNISTLTAGAVTNPLTGQPWLDPYTFYGACEIAAIKLLTRFNGTQRIFWLGQTYVDHGVSAPGGWANSRTNLLGYTQWNYKEATRAVADKYGIPFKDMLEECGWSTPNIATYVNPEGGLASYIHPSTAVGAPRMASVLQPWLNDHAALY